MIETRPKRRVTVTLENRPAPLDAALAFENLSSMTRDSLAQKKTAIDAKVEAMKKELQPVVDEAAKLANELSELREKNQAKLLELQHRPMLALLRERHVPESFIRQLQGNAAQASDLLQNAERDLREVPRRVDDLREADLVLRNYPRLPYREAGLFPEGPSRIEATVRLHAHAAKTVTSLIDTILFLLGEINVRLQATATQAPLEPGTPVVVSNPEDDRYNRRTVPDAVRDFDVLGGNNG